MSEYKMQELIHNMRKAETLLETTKCDICKQPANTIEIANGAIYGAVCDDCRDENLEDADEFSSMPKGV